ncbi:MAG TPA: tetratricopeptide repeat protein [Steroidobacteraceae bacterium]
MAAAKSLRFPYDQEPYGYDGAELQKAWDRLHKGDREPYPEAAAVQQAWRAFHRGDFADTISQGARQAALGSIPASKAAAVAATYLEEDDRRALRLLEDAAKRAEEATRKLPEHANAWYMLAFVLGRYAQRISIVKALAEGIGSKVRKALDRAIELEPRHADAHIALGLYHAEIIDKVGALAGRLTYGADAAQSVKHFEQALKLNPGSAIAHMEYANGLLMLHGDKKKKQAVELYRKAAVCKPADAMERLDVEQAKAELV